MAIVTLNGGWYRSSSNQHSEPALSEGSYRQELGRDENLRSAGPG